MVAARFGVGSIRRSQAAQEQEKDDKVEKMQALVEQRLSMVDGFRAEYFMQLGRFGRGLAKWQESAFAWVEPDWEADPETWPPAARVLYRTVQMNTLVRNIGWLQTIGRPGLCLTCKDEGKVEAPADADYYAFYCPVHEVDNAVGSVKTLARVLFDCDAEGREHKARKAAERADVERIAEEAALFERLK